MTSDLHAGFAALEPTGKARVLARLIHMETILVRDAHIIDPHDCERLYASSEFMHRLSGFIVGVLDPDSPEGREKGMIDTVLRSIQPRGVYYVDKLAGWISAEA